MRLKCIFFANKELTSVLVMVDMYKHMMSTAVVPIGVSPGTSYAEAPCAEASQQGLS